MNEELLLALLQTMKELNANISKQNAQIELNNNLLIAQNPNFSSEVREMAMANIATATRLMILKNEPESTVFR